MTSFTSLIVMGVIVIITFFILGFAMNIVLNVVVPPHNEEYDRYIHIRDFSNCTKSKR
jgi:hypothetical protein